MLATRIRQKEGVFYFISYKATDLLDRVVFTSRYYFEGDKIEQEDAGSDEVARFIAGIERNERGFQRLLTRRKVKQIVNFYETAISQPLIPGAILLFTDETLRFEPTAGPEIGRLSSPHGKYLVIDGQHRLAGLHFFREKYPEQISQIEVPCMLFDGKSADFATEMFVIINSTHTKINKSHLVDLYERVSWESREKKFAAKIIKALYEEADSPLRYKINRLGGRSRQEKWVLQSELFNEIHKLVEKKDFFEMELRMNPDKSYGLVRDYLKAVADVMEQAWGKNDRYIFTRDVTLKALIRVLGDLMEKQRVMDSYLQNPSPKVFKEILQPWKEMVKEFRAEGFYERFPAKGQVERVRRVHERLSRALAA
jgi:DGQHR domain-containing protein